MNVNNNSCTDGKVHHIKHDILQPVISIMNYVFICLYGSSAWVTEIIFTSHPAKPPARPRVRSTAIVVPLVITAGWTHHYFQNVRRLAVK